MMTNCIVQIKKFEGDESSKTLKILANDIKALLLPAGEAILALYPDLPVGQGYQYMIVTDELASIPSESQIVVTDSMYSELEEEMTFIVQGDNRRNKIGGQIYNVGTCIRKDN